MQQAQGHAVGVGTQRREAFRPGLGRYLKPQVRRPGPQGPFAAVQEVAAEMQFAVAGQRPQRRGAEFLDLSLLADATHSIRATFVLSLSKDNSARNAWFDRLTTNGTPWLTTNGTPCSPRTAK
jgi:hypothetical protein